MTHDGSSRLRRMEPEGRLGESDGFGGIRRELLEAIEEEETPPPLPPVAEDDEVVAAEDEALEVLEAVRATAAGRGVAMGMDEEDVAEDDGPTVDGSCGVVVVAMMGVYKLSVGLPWVCLIADGLGSNRFGVSPFHLAPV